MTGTCFIDAEKMKLNPEQGKFKLGKFYLEEEIKY